MEGQGGVLGIRYNNTFVNNWRILETRLAIESNCSPAMLNRVRSFRGETPSHHVVTRSAEFCGLFWLTLYRINDGQVPEDSVAWDAVVVSFMAEVTMAQLRQIADWQDSEGLRSVPPWQIGK